MMISSSCVSLGWRIAGRAAASASAAVVRGGAVPAAASAIREIKIPGTAARAAALLLVANPAAGKKAWSAVRDWAQVAHWPKVMPVVHAHEMRGTHRPRAAEAEAEDGKQEDALSENADVRRDAIQSVHPLLRLTMSYWMDILIAVILASGAALAFSMVPTLLGNLYDVAAESAKRASQSSADGESPGSSTTGCGDNLALGDLFRASSFVPIIPFVRTALCFLGAAALRSLSFLSVMRLGCKVKREMHVALMCSLLRKDMEWFDENDASELSERMRADVEEVKRLTTSLATCVASIGQVVVGLALIASTSPSLALVIVGSLPFGVAVAVASLNAVGAARARERREQLRAHMAVSNALSGVRTIRSFRAEDKIVRQFSHRMADWESEYARSSVATAMHAGLFLMLQLGGICSWLYCGSLLCGSGSLSVGQLSSIISQCQQLGLGLASLSSLHEQVARASDASQRIFSILDSEPSIELTRGLSFPAHGRTHDGHAPGRDQIRFDGVSFAYPSRPLEPVLRELTLSIPPGKTTAIVGASGSGKSTVAVLLQRMYDPDGGNVSVDGVDLRELDLKDFRAHLAVVSQEPILFPGSIYDNICFGVDPGSVSTEDVVAAAKAAHAHEFITGLKDGYLTEVGDRGAELSGGQKQRVALARAFLLRPRIILLDEATSALDLETERVVQAAISRTMSEATVVIIAHRLSSIQNADNIIVMERGRVVEAGSHLELIRKKGAYYTLLKSKMD